MSERDTPASAGGLTHFDAAGRAHMVAITQKPETPRGARAHARVTMASATLARIRDGEAAKGDVLAVARLAAIQATKTTSTAIPLCHPVRVTAVQVRFEAIDQPPAIDVEVEVHAFDRTGPDMEALHAAGVAALTVIDMCKAIDRTMSIEGLRIVEKWGGRSGHHGAPSST